jgi:hypothetical protein
MTQETALRFAVLCRGRLAAWQASCIEQLVASGHARPVLLVRDTSARAPGARTGSLLYRLYAERWVKPRSRALHEVDATGAMPAVEVIDCAGRLEPGHIARIRDHRLDFILQFGFDDTSGILDAARFGLWAYDHDSQPGGAAPHFWQLARGAATTDVVLRRLTGPGRGVVLFRGSFGTCKASWVNNVDRACTGGASFCAHVCGAIAAGAESLLSRPESSPPDEPAPDGQDFFRFAVRSGSHLARKLAELLLHVEVWNVGVTRDSPERILERGRIDADGVTWCVPRGRDHFIADPFAFEDRGERILFEEFGASAKGRICSIPLSNLNQPIEPRVEFEHSYHMSYPCLFRDGGETYCVPETYQSRRICLYRRTGDHWRLERTLLEGRPFVDPTLFEHQGRYWLFFTLQDDGAYGNQTLHACHAESLHSEWRPHALDPLKSDIGSSRPAGTPLVIGGELYRPAQDCSETYGGALVLNRITRLTPTEFEETVAARIAPIANSPYPDGLHTLVRMGSGAVFDGKRFRFHPLAWRHNWRRLHEVFA